MVTEHAWQPVFESLQKIGWRILEDWRRDKQAETEFLEFKSKKRPTVPELDPEDKEAIAKTISGFANTGGGVLVLGVRVQNGKKDEPDRVDRVAPITKVDECWAWLDRHAWEFAEPPVAGLALLAIRDPTDTSRGVVAIKVPASAGGPHRVKAATQETNNRYFMRTATNTTDMPHSLLADRFGRRALPSLRLVARIEGAGGEYVLRLRIHNRGRGTARHPGLKISDLRSLGYVAPEENQFYGVDFVLEPYAWFHDAASDTVVYPGAAYSLPQIRLTNFSAAAAPHTIRGTIFAIDASPIEFQGELLLGVDATLPPD